MLAALASPCRIKRNHRRRRRIASGRAVYAYVGGNPLAMLDPFGLSGASGGWSSGGGATGAWTTANTTANVLGWLCKAQQSGMNPNGMDPLSYLMDARARGLDKGDSNLAAAERYMEAYEGNYDGYYLGQDNYLFGMNFLKWGRAIPYIGGWFGHNGAPPEDSAFISKWGMLGNMDNREGEPIGGSTPPCGCGK
jgi:hypothetical protein